MFAAICVFFAFVVSSVYNYLIVKEQRLVTLDFWLPTLFAFPALLSLLYLGDTFGAAMLALGIGVAYLGLIAFFMSPVQRQRRYLARFPEVEQELNSFAKWILERCETENLSTNLPPSIIRALLRVVREVYLTSFKEVYKFEENATYLKEALGRRLNNPDLAYKLYRKHLGEALMIYLRAIHTDRNCLYSAPAIETMPDARRVGVAMLHELYSLNNKEHQPMPRLWDTINTNVWRVTRAQLPLDQQNRGERLWPNLFEGDADKFLRTYLVDTPLLKLFYEEVPVYIPPKMRLEHMFICAGSGTGKTQLMQAMIDQDLYSVAFHGTSIIVIDSQGADTETYDVKKPTIIDNLIRLDLFQDNDRLVYITPRPGLQLNFFDTGFNDANLTPKEREIRRTAAVETVKSALGATTELQHQMLSVVVEFAMRNPKPSIAHIGKILATPEKEFQGAFKEELKDAPASMKEYFKTFHSGNRIPSKDALLTRVQALTNNTLFMAMADAERNDFRMIDLVESGKVIVVDADKGRLGRHGAEAFGRYFIAQLLYAGRQRETNKPVYCYVDEAHDFVSDDDHIVDLLAQARKRDIGMVLATPSLGLINSQAVKSALQNVSTVVTSTGTTGIFTANIRGIGPKIKVTVPMGKLEKQTRMSKKTFEGTYGTKETSVVIPPPGSKVEDIHLPPPPTEEHEEGVIR